MASQLTPTNLASSRSATKSAAVAQAEKVKTYVNQQLESTRRQVKLVDLMAGGLVLVAVTLAALLVLALIDAWVWPLTPLARGVSFTALCLFWVGYAVFAIVPLLFKKINPEYAAKMIEEAKPSFKNSLLNYVSFRKQPTAIKPAVLDAVSRQAASDLASVPVDATVDRSKLIRLGFILVGLTLFAVGYKVLSPKDPLQTFARVLIPSAKIAKPAVVKIRKVEPGDTAVFFGDSLNVTAEVVGRHSVEDVQLKFSTRDGQHIDQTIPMKPGDGPNRYQADLSILGGGIQQSLDYHIVARDGISPLYSVDVRPNPSISIESLTLTPPAYTKLSPRELLGQGNIEAIEGTWATVKAIANLPIKVAYIELLNEVSGGAAGDSQFRTVSSIEMRFEGRSAEGRFPVLLDSTREQQLATHYRVKFVSTTDDRSRQPNVYPIRVIADLGPEIIVRHPAQPNVEVPENGELHIALEASDLDFEISSVALRIDHDGQRLLDKRLQLSSDDGNRSVKAGYRFRPDELGLQAGDQAIFFATAADNRVASQTDRLEPNFTRTDNYTVLVVAKDDSLPPPQQGTDSEQPSDAQSNDKPAADNAPDKSPDQNSDPNQTGSRDSNDQPSDPQDENADQPGEQDSGQPGQQPDAGQQEPGKQEDRSDGRGQESEQSEPGQQDQTSQGSESGESSDSSDNSESKGSDANDGRTPDQPKDANGEDSSSNGTDSNAEGSESGGAKNDDAMESQQQSASEGGSESGSESGSEGGQGSENGGADSGGGKSDTNAGQSKQGNNPADASNGPPGAENPGDPSNKATGKPGAENANSDSGRQDQRVTQGDREKLDRNASESEVIREMQEFFDEQENTSPPESNNGADPKSGDPKSGDPKSGDPKSGDSQAKQPQDGQPADETNQVKPGEQQADTTDNQGSSDESNKQAQQGNPQDNQAKEGNDANGNPQEGDAQDGNPGSGSQPKDANSDQPESTKDGAGRPQSDQPKSDQPKSGEPGSGERSDPQGQGDQAEQGNPESTGSEAGGGSKSKQSGNEGTPGGKGGDNASDPNSQETGGGSGESTSNGSDPKATKSQESSEGGGGSSDNAAAGGDASAAAPSDSNSKGVQSGSATEQQPGGMEGGAGAGAGTAGTDFLGEEKENIEHARKATDMILNKLREQNYEPDPELLKRLNKTKAELQEFAQRWEEMKRNAQTGDPNAVRKYERELKNLALRPSQSKRGLNQSNANTAGLNQNATVNEPPAEVAPDFRSFMQDLNRSRKR